MGSSLNRLELVRATEAAALEAARWMGLGRAADADAATTRAMLGALSEIEIDGRVVLAETRRVGQGFVEAGQAVGTGRGPAVDVVLDPIDGRSLVAEGRGGALSVLAAAPRGCLWAPDPALYMEKLVVDARMAEALVPECLDAPAAWTLALIARVKQKSISDLVVFVLDRPRHVDLIEEIRSAGARVLLQNEGDIAGAIWAAKRDLAVDVLMGVGGVTEGILAACAVKVLGGAMLGRLAPQSAAERSALEDAGLDTQRIMTGSEIVGTDEVSFVATSITGGQLLKPIRFHGDWAESDSLVLAGETSRQRLIHTEHLVLRPR
jgi:fructose-1,6-bisphosphatase II